MKKLLRFKKRIIASVLTFACAICLAHIARPMAVNVFNSISQGERKLPIYCVDTDENKVAISFDAAWGADDTDTLLDILKQNNVKATFFMCGYWVDKYPEEGKKIASAGHDLGNHSATHPHMNSLSSEQIKKEIQDTHQKVLNITGYEMELFRPPFGEYNNTVIQAASECGYHTIQWDVDSLNMV